MKEREWGEQETPLLRLNEYLMDCVSASSSSTKTQNRVFDVLFPGTTVKRSPSVCMLTCYYCVFIIVLRGRSINRTGYLETTKMGRTNKARLAVCSKAIVKR